MDIPISKNKTLEAIAAASNLCFSSVSECCAHLAAEVEKIALARRLPCPTADEVKAARLKAGHTQIEAAACIGAGLKTWQNWEASSRSKAYRKMPAAKFVAYLKITEGK